MSKIRIRVGDLEIEFEGSEDFIKEQIPEILQDVADIKAPSSMQTTEEEIEEISQEEQKKFVDFSTATIAQKIDVKTGKELVIAAAAFLTFVKNKPSFHRREILDAMKGATPYYQQNYSKSLSRYLNQLVREGTFNKTSAGTYALSMRVRRDLEERIVG